MKKVIRGMNVLLTAALVISALCASASAVEYKLDGLWLTEGDGWLKKGDFIKVGIANSGWIDLHSITSGDQEWVVSYDLHAELVATSMNVTAWDIDKSDDFHIPIPIPETFNPTVNEPFDLIPEITVETEECRLTYKFILESESAGKLTAHGLIYDLPVVGTIEGDLTNTLWKSGTEKPFVEPTESGCAVGAAAAAVIAACAALCGRRGR